MWNTFFSWSPTLSWIMGWGLALYYFLRLRKLEKTIQAVLTQRENKENKNDAS